jgi:hypothetical protein
VHRLRPYIIGAVIIACALIGGCTSAPESTGPKFSGRLLLLAGGNTDGANLVELSPSGSTYNLSTLTSGVFEASPSPDRTRLIYTTKDEILLRDLRTGAVKSLIKGAGLCLAWAPDGNHFSYKQKTADKANGAATKLYVSDLDSKTKLIWDDPFDPSVQSAGPDTEIHASGCAQWIAPNRLVFDRLVGAAPKQKTAGEAHKPNTTTVAVLGDTVKLVDAERKWSVEAVCPAGGAVFLRPADQAQPVLVARRLDDFKTLDPKPVDCSGCRFVGFAAGSCLPFFIQDATSTTTDLVSLNPTNWQRQKAATISQTFSPNAKMLIKSSARLMIVGDVSSKLLLVDTESGDITPFFPEAATAARNAGPLLSPVPVVWIEN